MDITIHRGSRQIGGSCLEIRHNDTRVIFDVGLPLSALGARQTHNNTLSVPGLLNDTTDSASVAALFLSHAHADHSGLISATRADVPVHMSEGTSKMMLAGSLFAKQPSVERHRVRKFVPRQARKIGSLSITAFPVDHSVYDSMAFLIEAGGKRVIYTGDLRMHGRKPGMARALLAVARKAPIDALVIEGTRIGGRASEVNLSEKDLTALLAHDIRGAGGPVLALYSPLNVDRFVSFFKAARQAKRAMVIDPYQAFVLHLLSARKTLPQPTRDGALRVLLPPRFWASGAGRRLATTPWAQRLREIGITAEEFRATATKSVLLYRDSMRSWLFPNGFDEGVAAIFSYWGGYLNEARQVELIAALKSAGGNLRHRHASGHAHPDDLRDFVDQINPRMLVPIHTEVPEAWARVYPAVARSNDGDEFSL